MGGKPSSSEEARAVGERLTQKLNDVNVAAQSQFSPIQDHYTYTLEKAFCKCVYECIDRSKKLDEIKDCVKQCTVPVRQATDLYDSEMVKFREGLSKALKACIDKAETSKQNKSDVVRDLESCHDQAIQDSLGTLPAVVERMKNDLSVPQ